MNHFDDHIEHVKERCPDLDPSESYLLERIFAEEVWSALTPSERRALGRHVSFLVKKNQLPLVAVGMTSSHAKLYRRK
jgi:hypothetical protein